MTPVDRREQGLTVIEMTVVLLLMSIVMSAAVIGLISVQSSATNNLVREQGIEQAEIAMQVISRDLRATADSPTSGLPLISAMTASSVTFASDIDTTSSANPMAVGTGSEFTGCPDQITITGSASTPGTITETRTHPDPAVAPSTVVASCTWTGGSTAAVTITITVPPSNNSPAVPAATLVQTVQFAGFTNSLSQGGG
jgi:type II secretory pathway pseudopilin PulG